MDFKKFASAVGKQFEGVELDYLGGHPDLPKAQRVRLVAVGDFIKFEVGKLERSDTSRFIDAIAFAAVSKGPLLTLAKSDVVNVYLERASKGSLGGGIKGALIGGALGGQGGALLGGVIGGRGRDDSVIVMTIRRGPMTVDIRFGGKDISKKYGEFAKLF